MRHKHIESVVVVVGAAAAADTHRPNTHTQGATRRTSGELWWWRVLCWHSWSLRWHHKCGGAHTLLRNMQTKTTKTELHIYLKRASWRCIYAFFRHISTKKPTCVQHSFPFTVCVCVFKKMHKYYRRLFLFSTRENTFENIHSHILWCPPPHPHTENDRIL